MESIVDSDSTSTFVDVNTAHALDSDVVQTVDLSKIPIAIAPDIDEPAPNVFSHPPLEEEIEEGSDWDVEVLDHDYEDVEVDVLEAELLFENDGYNRENDGVGVNSWLVDDEVIVESNNDFLGGG